MFDVETFMNQQSDPMASTMTVCPEGSFPFILDTNPEMLKPREIKWQDKQTGADRVFYQLELFGICQDEAVKAKLGLSTVRVRLRINLDVDEHGKLENGVNKNVALGALREALKQNAQGWKPIHLLGAGPFMGKVTHQSDKQDPSKKYADITRVAPIR